MKISAGGIIINDKNQILLCHPTGSKEGVWKFPKGELEKSEFPQQAALREVLEETGWKCIISYSDAIIVKGKEKDVYYFIMRPIEKIGEPDWENDEFVWARWDDTVFYLNEKDFKVLEQTKSIITLKRPSAIG